MERLRATVTTIDLGGGDVQPQQAGTTCFVAKMTPDGGLDWARGYSCDFAQVGARVAVGPSGDVVVGADFIGTTDYGDGPVSSTGGSDDAFVFKLDASGAYVWSRVFGTPGYDSVHDSAVDSAGNVILTGAVSGAVDFGGGVLAGGGGLDAFLLKLAP